MSSSKAFVLPVKLRDALVDLKGLSLEARGAFTTFWYLHEMARQPLPPREEKIPPAEWDEWFRDQLDMKNIRTWRRVRDELLAKARIRQADDGRLYIGRTMRAVAEKRGEDPSVYGGDTPQRSLDLQGAHHAQRRGDKPVDAPVQFPASPEVQPIIGQTSPDVRPIFVFNPLKFLKTGPALSYSKSKSHEVVAVIGAVAARGRTTTRGDPLPVRA